MSSLHSFFSWHIEDRISQTPSGRYIGTIWSSLSKGSVNGSDVFLLVRGPISWFDTPLSAILAMTVEDTG